MLPLRFSLVATLAWAPLLAAQTPGTILGTWEGTSICVKDGRHPACHDEVVHYRFVPDTADSAQVTLHAFKRVGTDWEWMGDINFGWDSTATAWSGDFQNTRVHIRWLYQVRGDSLTGRLIDLPDGRVARNAQATRVAPTGGH
jgi:hypothetical protein